MRSTDAFAFISRPSIFPAVFQPNSFDLSKPAAEPQHWLLDPEVIFLNHGAFGACPKRVLERQAEWRARIERQPLQFVGRDLEGHLDSARETVAAFVGARAEDLVFVPNATSGVNAVVRSLSFDKGDELLVTDQEYNACRNALNFAAERAGARVVVANLPFPVRNEEQLVAPILERVTGKTRLALVDQVTSQTGLILPIERLVRELKTRGVDTLVDGAHAPGMVALDLNRLGAAYYTGNCHKWLCAPKGAAFLHVRSDKQSLVRPVAISHGANTRRTDRSRFLIEFAWPGTWDPTAALSVPEALEFVGSLLPGGWPEIMARNRSLALAARNILCAALSIDAPAPEDRIGSLAAVPIPDARAGDEPILPTNEYALQETLRVKHHIEVPIIPWPAPPKRTLRVSAQLYNSLPQYEKLARVLIGELR
jgi:isopenicillin-N epimerase